MQRRSRLFGVASVALLALVANSVAFGQAGNQNDPRARDANQRQPQAPPGAQQGAQPESQARPGQAGAQSSSADAQIATWIAIGDKMEITLGQFAAENATTREVKEFAAMMVKDHTQSLQQLQQFGAQVQPPQQGGQARAGRATDQQQQITARRIPQQGGPAGGLDLLQVKQQIGEQLTQAALKELQSKKGIELDTCFIDQQVVAHMEQLQTLDVLSEQASDKLQPVLQKEMESVKQHLQHAQRISEMLHQQAGASGAQQRQPQSPPQQRPQQPQQQPQRQPQPQ